MGLPFAVALALAYVLILAIFVTGPLSVVFPLPALVSGNKTAPVSEVPIQTALIFMQKTSPVSVFSPQPSVLFDYETVSGSRSDAFKTSTPVAPTCILPPWYDMWKIINESYRMNDTDIASLPWVQRKKNNILNVPKVKCEHKGIVHRRVVVVLVDAISRSLFESKYPRSMNFGQQHHDVFAFKNHHTMGFNSPPNKKAIFAGMCDLCGNKAKYTPKWLHKTFKRSGYTTIHADDVCNPKTVTGSLTGIMKIKLGDVMPDNRALCNNGRHHHVLRCSDPDNKESCFAPSSLEFVAQAVEQHAQCDLFVTVNPNHEHSSRCWYSKADLWLLRFLERVVDRDTIAVIMSDHGLHYGPLYQSQMGKIYRTNPVLLILWPKRMRGADSKALQRSTLGSLTTHLNVYAFLDAIASGTVHSSTSLASPKFALNQSCEDALIQSTECRCINAVSCTNVTKETAMIPFKDQLRDVSANPHCLPLKMSEFWIESCTRTGNAHTATMRRGQRVYELMWDSHNGDTKSLVQMTPWANDIHPCRSVVSNMLWHLCICRTRDHTTSFVERDNSLHALRVENSILRNHTVAFGGRDGALEDGSIRISFMGGAFALWCLIGLAGRAVWVRVNCGPLAGAANGSLKEPRLLTMGCCMLCTCMATLQSIVLHFSKVNGRVEYHMPSAVFYTELLKLIVSITLWIAIPSTHSSRLTHGRHGKLASCNRSPFASVLYQFAGLMPYAILAALYLAQNNLTIRAMSLLDPPTFQLWVHFRLLPAAFLTRFVLKRRITFVQWTALILLMLGMGITTLKQDRHVYVSTQSVNYEWRGIVLVLFNGCLSATSSVMNEWMLKYQDASLSMTLKNILIYAFGALLAVPTMHLPWTPGALQGFSPSAWVVVCTNAALGLSVSLVLRYTDNLVKNFAGAAAVILSAIVSAPLFGFEWTYPFVIGVLVICCAFVLYFCASAEATAASHTVLQHKTQELLSSTKAPAFNTVITFGTFDVLHHGHVRILQRAAAYGRRLVVGLSTDELNMKKKNRIPVYPYAQRKAILESISCVDLVFAEESLEEKEDYCRQYGADVLVMGDDWAGKFDAVGVQVRYLERTPDISTTQTIETVLIMSAAKSTRV